MKVEHIHQPAQGRERGKEEIEGGKEEKRKRGTEEGREGETKNINKIPLKNKYKEMNIRPIP